MPVAAIIRNVPASKSRHILITAHSGRDKIAISFVKDFFFEPKRGWKCVIMHR